MATVGDSSAKSSNTIYYDALLSTTLMAYKKQLYDNIFKDSAYLAYLRQAGAVRKQNGGERVAMPLMYGKNTTVGVHAGYEVIDTTPQEGITTAFFEWAEVAGSISISRKEERQNSGEGRLVNLLESKTKQAEMTMREELNQGLIEGTVSGTTFLPNSSVGGTSGLNPLPWFVRKAPATDPTNANVGNISAASEDWWRPMVADGGGSKPAGGAFGINVSTYAGMIVLLRRMYNYCSRGSGGSPDLCVFDQVTFETYENAMDVKVRYQNTKMADMGFDTIKLRGATCIWDESVPDLETGVAHDSDSFAAGTAFFINTNFYNLIIDSETDIITTPFVEPENQTAKTAKILFMGQAACSNLRKQGAIWGMSQSIVA